MNDNSIEISRYLQNEMESDERASFENQLAADENLRKEMSAQQQVTMAAQNAGLKQTFASLIHKRMMWQRFIRPVVILVLLVVVIVTWFVVEDAGKSGKADQQATSADSLTKKFVDPPLVKADVPWSEYELDAEKGDTIFHSSGSILLFPPLSMIDENGNLIKGKVQLRYREFSNPLDIYLSGIPMAYDSAGVNYTFISAGMCELLAYQNGKAVFVNPAAKPEINLVTNDKSPLHNIYYLDTIQKKWLPQSKSILTDLTTSVAKQPVPIDTAYSSSQSSGEYKEPDNPPLLPSQPNHDNPVIRITVDPTSFQELMVYDNLQFELLPNEKNFNPKDTTGEWSDVQLRKAGNTGFYFVTFSRPGRTVSYQAKPVFEGEDYDKAMTIFKKKQSDYEAARSSRKKNNANDYQNYRLDSLESVAIEKENKQMLKLNALIEKRNRQLKTAVAVSEATYNQRRFRPMTIAQFGTWNCDTPYLGNLIEITATFTDQNDQPIELTHIAVFCPNYNTTFRFTNNRIGIVENAPNMIVGLSNGVFTFLTYEDFAAQNKAHQSTKRNFKMTVAAKEKTDYSDVVKAVN